MISTSDKTRFVSQLGAVYEHSEWVAIQLWERRSQVNWESLSSVAESMAEVVDSAGERQLLDLIRAHPDLAGRAALAGELTEDSAAEQAASGLDQCSAQELAEFQKLNAQYKDRFDFPFIVAVKGLSRAQILNAFRARLANSVEAERQTAVTEIHKIAKLRLAAMDCWSESLDGEADRMIRSPVNLALERLGAEVVYATDDFFAPKNRVILPEEPVFIPGKYDDHGKWMDGWESRRKRGPGFDYCIIKLGAASIVNQLEIDTRHFTGNYPPAASIDAIRSDDAVPEETASWREILPTVDLRGDAVQSFDVLPGEPWTHLRLNIYPDGGVARLRVYGSVRVDWSSTNAGQIIDLAAVINGGQALSCNNEHYGRVSNMLMPGDGINMGDGWETRRRRTPGHDWALIELGASAYIESITVDTAFFKGNFPESCSIQAAPAGAASIEETSAQSAHWPILLPKSRLEADRKHTFSEELLEHEPVKLIRLNIHPDGGVSRLRVMGRVV